MDDTRKQLMAAGHSKPKPSSSRCSDAVEDPRKAPTLASILTQFGDTNDVLPKALFFRAARLRALVHVRRSRPQR